MIPAHLRETVSRLHAAANALAALGAALDARASGAPLPAALAPRVDEVLALLGIDGLEHLTQAELRSTLGEIRTFSLTNAKLLFAASRGAGWSHTERELLEAAGDVSVTFPHQLKHVLAGRLDGLGERLAQPGAAFLDVGTGVAAMAIEMARLWPQLRVVGIDRSRSALAIARERVRAAECEARIELREQSVEALSDEACFDLAWIPSAFVSAQALAFAVERVRRALRPGGFVLVPMLRAGGEDLASALAGLRVAMFGGTWTTQEAVMQLLSAKRFCDVRAMPAAQAALTGLIVGRR